MHILRFYFVGQTLAVYLTPHFEAPSDVTKIWRQVEMDSLNDVLEDYKVQHLFCLNAQKQKW